MNGLLAIAECFLDRMTNPRYETAINDEYSLRFDQILAGDREFADNFARLALEPEDIDSLPTCAWPWYLQWRIGRASPPTVAFLDALFEATDDPAIRLSVLLSALSDGDPESQAADHPVGSEDWRDRLLTEQLAAIPSRWLRMRLSRMVSGTESETNGPGDVPGVIELGTFLLQLGDGASLQILQALLGIHWDGRPRLVEAIQGYLTDAGLDPETEATWRSQLGLAEL
jgi:hypothetical protein